MMAFWLRCRLAAEAVLLIAAGALLVRSGASSPTAAVFAAVAMLLMLHSDVVVLSFAVSRLHAATGPEPAHGRPSLLCIAMIEWLAYQALFVFIQPFERLWMGHDTTGRRTPEHVPLLLIHGYLCNRGAWWWLRRKLQAAGFVVATIDLEPPLGDIDGFADQVHARVEAMCAETGVGRVALIGHSMGGLAARAYLHRHGARRVAKLVTLGSPHHGTWIARCGLGKDARQMEPDSAWTRALPEVEAGVPTVTVWSPTDNFIAPPESSRLAGAREIVLPGLSHLAMLFSPAVLDTLTRELPSTRDS